MGEQEIKTNSACRALTGRDEKISSACHALTGAAFFM
jgi:hypothetical protein